MLLSLIDLLNRIAARDPRAVVTWRDEVAELTSNGGMIRNDKAEQLYQPAPSAAGSDGALSAMTYKPSRVSIFPFLSFSL